MREGFRPATFNAYRVGVADAAVPETARGVLLRVMSQGTGRLPVAYQDSLALLQTALLDNPATPIALRVMALVQLGATSRPADPAVFFSYARSEDSRLKIAAYQALGHRIHLNRKSGHSIRNRLLFDSLKAASGDAPDLNQARAMAQISEDYARDYLAVHCVGQVDKMVAVFRHDENPAHAGLLGAAAEFLDGGSNEAVLRPVLLQEVKASGPIIENMLAGTARERVAGLALQRAFSGHTPQPVTP